MIMPRVAPIVDCARKRLAWLDVIACATTIGGGGLLLDALELPSPPHAASATAGVSAPIALRIDDRSMPPESKSASATQTSLGRGNNTVSEIRITITPPRLFFAPGMLVRASAMRSKDHDRPNGGCGATSLDLDCAMKRKTSYLIAGQRPRQGRPASNAPTG
ncbi:hypothetical protein [Sphingomonas sp. 10B4]|uniref:hypothetical protein n=1 Tax=Sphingomonas sp. 10B4 TaxID=3048575 RepID=UPI002B236BD8|nr:hypothetical protein [Sphingomonas sp. 10B4]